MVRILRELVPKSFEIMSMEEQHLSAALKLWNATPEVLLTDADTKSGLADYLERNPEISQVAIKRKRVVGAVLCGHDGRRGYLHHLAVQEKFRHQGIGRALVRAALEKLEVEGITKCNLFVVESNKTGKKFWQQDGWSEWEDLRLMSRKL